jgi:Uma2 family endonuclease
MAIAPREAGPALLTYEEYLAEGEVFKRYDIIDGARIFMADPTRQHQEILLNVAERLRAFQRRTGLGRTLVAPQDVLITRVPLRSRQPDVLFISHAQLAKCAPADAPDPLLAAPELVVEILSPSETRRAREEKLRDYAAAGVRECWMVSPGAETVEVLRLTPQGPEPVALYQQGETVQSLAFPELTVPVAEIFVL